MPPAFHVIFVSLLTGLFFFGCWPPWSATCLLWAMVTNSIGGTVAGIPSGYESIVRLSGVETRVTYHLPTWALGAIVLLTIAMLVIAFTDSSGKAAPAEEAVAVES